MVWPTGNVGSTNVDAGTDSPALARISLLDLITKFNQLMNHISPIWQSILSNNGAYTTSLPVNYSSTLSLDANLTNVFEITPLTGNVTSMTILNGANNGRTINIRFQQDATGGRTVTLPTGAAVSGAINLTGNRVSWLSLIYSGHGVRWEGSWLALP